MSLGESLDEIIKKKTDCGLIKNRAGDGFAGKKFGRAVV